MKVCCRVVIKVFPELRYGFSLLFIPAITQPLQEEQREDKVAKVCWIYWAAQNIGGFPEPGLNLWLRNL
jgi:hypothetical protein